MMMTQKINMVVIGKMLKNIIKTREDIKKEIINRIIYVFQKMEGIKA